MLRQVTRDGFGGATQKIKQIYKIFSLFTTPKHICPLKTPQAKTEPFKHFSTINQPQHFHTHTKTAPPLIQPTNPFRPCPSIPIIIALHPARAPFHTPPSRATLSVGVRPYPQKLTPSCKFKVRPQHLLGGDRQTTDTMGRRWRATVAPSCWQAESWCLCWYCRVSWLSLLLFGGWRITSKVLMEGRVVCDFFVLIDWGREVDGVDFI